ncbi:MAG: hypothetical protein JRJ80_00910 [Deltaproteobacteria bacterium]|nr:hypothetical protein [Deltaproteobacteria bacterium]
MGYSSAGEARQAREALGKALEALQQDEDVPKEVLGIIQNVAKSVGALFEAEYASTEPDGKTCVKSALGTLSQTLALLQDVKSEHSGVQGATESIADVVGILFPLTNKPSVRPDAASQRPASQRSPASAPPASAPPASAPPASAPPASAPPASAPPASATPSVAPAASATPSVAPAAQRPLSPSNRPSTRPLSSRPVSGAPAPIPTSMLPPPAPIPRGARRPVEANLGATTQSNFYVGFSGEIAHGGVFLATYEALPKDTSVRMLVTLPGGFELECDGYVRFVRDPMDFMSESEPGMGIQFEGLSDEARDLVLRFIRKRPPIFYDV